MFFYGLVGGFFSIELSHSSTRKASLRNYLNNEFNSYYWILTFDMLLFLKIDTILLKRKIKEFS